MESKKKIVESELNLLDSSIEYAEDHAAERDYQFTDEELKPLLYKLHSGQQDAYLEFRRVAWGKAIRVKTKFQGEVIYRLSQSAAVLPGNIATPNSPIGRLVNVAREGNVYSSERLGDYSIEDVWFFERYSGAESLKNRKNFKKMLSKGVNNFTLKNLQAWIKKAISKADTEAEEAVIEVGGSEGISDLSDWDDISFEPTEAELELESKTQKIDDEKGISLPAKFYVNLNEQQYDAAHFGTAGLVTVFGVAGSGKTSVALGRSKSLAQLGQLPKSDKLYNPDFAEESQLGIVRTGELITYLRDTCAALSLHRLPVVEYREIYEELKTHWDIEQSSSQKKVSPKYLLSVDESPSDLDSRIEWFYLVSSRMLEIYSASINSSLEEKIENVSSMDGDIFPKVFNLIRADVSNALNSTDLIGFLARLENLLQRSVEKLFSHSIWTGVPQKTGSDYVWFNTRDDVIKHLISTQRMLCLYRGVHNVSIVVPEAVIGNWKDWMPADATIPPRSKIPTTIEFSASKDKTIQINVVSATNEKLLEYLTVGSLRIYEGVGKKTATVRTKELLLADMPRMVSRSELSRGAEKNARQWRTNVRNRVLSTVRRLFNQLPPAVLYYEALASLAESDSGDKFSAVVETKLENLRNRHLTERDIDFLVAFMSAITRELNSNSPIISNSRLRPPPYRSSIFIDEVQDFSEIQIFALSMLSNPKYSVVTAVGDPAQCLYNNAADISASFPNSMQRSAKKEELMENVRQQDVPTINALGCAFRNKYIGDMTLPVVGYEPNSSLNLYQRDSAVEQLRLAYKLLSNISRLETVVIVVPSIEHARDAVTLLGPHLRERQHRECSYSSTIELSKRYIAHVTTPKNIKGLEFDHLIAMYIDEYNLEETLDKNALYVIFTRPRQSLTIIGNLNAMATDFREFIQEFSTIQSEN